MLSNWRAILGFLAIAIFYEALVIFLWIGLRWMLTPYVPAKARLIIGIIYFIFANFSIFSYATRLGAPWTNYGNVWFFYFLYGLILMIVLIIVRFILKMFSINLTQGISLIVSAIFLVGITAFGLFWAYSPVVKEQTVKLDKEIDKPVKIAMVSDLHLGTFFGNGRLEELKKIIDEQKPDAVIIAGDIMDDDMIIYQKRNMGEKLKEITAPLGVYTVMGNHDNDVRAITNEVSNDGVKVLLDESTELTPQINLVGRNDKTDQNRKSTEELLQNVDTSKATILIDHQPDAVDHHSTLPIDIQLSGHTHRGQLWPFNYVTERVYTLDHGYAEINGKHFFTSSGYGFWGPPFKTTARSEVWMITVEGK